MLIIRRPSGNMSTFNDIDVARQHQPWLSTLW